METACSNASLDIMNCSSNSSNVTAVPSQQLYNVEEIFYMYIGPFVILFGIVGNGLTYIVLRKPPLNSFSTSVYIRTYAIMSILFLIFILGFDWIVHMFEGKQFKDIIGSACRFYECVSRIIIYSGIWIVNGATMDRCIRLWMPLTAQKFCSVFQAKIAVLCIMIGLLLVSVHAMWMLSLDNQGRCFMYHENRLGSTIWIWVSTFLYTFLPLSLLFITCNLIFLRLCLKYRGQQVPDTRIEYDQTYVTTILAMISFVLSLQATIIDMLNQLHADWRSHLKSGVVISNHILWICHISLFCIHYWCSEVFREGVCSLFTSPFKCTDVGTTLVESPTSVDEYTQVPSLTTEL